MTPSQQLMALSIRRQVSAAPACLGVLGKGMMALSTPTRTAAGGASLVPRSMTAMLHTSNLQCQLRLAVAPASRMTAITTTPSALKPYLPQQCHSYSIDATDAPPTTAGTTQPDPAAWTPPEDPFIRPVVVVGIGNMGKRLAVMWASTMRPVILYDHRQQSLDDAISYIGDTIGHVCALNGSHPGKVTMTTNLREACDSNPWMVIETLPEFLDLKTEVLGEVDALVPDDCVIATNSSSFLSKELAGRVKGKERLVNTHHHIPPRNIYVEVMPSAQTNPAVIPFLAEQMLAVGLKPIVVPRESQGYVFNRIWAAMKRETLKVLSEGVGKAEDVDALFRDFFHAEKGPCERMDEVGLDTVRRIEEHYLNMAGMREEDEEKRRHLVWLERKYVARGDLGEKAASGDGLLTDGQRRELKARRKRMKMKVVDEYKGA